MSDKLLDLEGLAYYKAKSDAELASALSEKTDKVNGATSGNFAGLDSSGNLTDSGKSISSFITNSVNNLTNYYLKTETYTKTEVQAIIGTIRQFHYEVYASLDAITNPASNVLYLIGPTGSGTDKYEEYVYTTEFIKTGDTSIDLTDYVTTSALNTALASYVTSSALATALADYTNTTDLNTLLSAKADKVSSSGSGHLASYDANGNLAVADVEAYRLFRDLGYNASQESITITAGQTGKYVQCATRSAVSNANFNISAPFSVDACDELLIKTGFNPSDSDHSSLDISIIAIYEEMQRTRVVQKKDSSNNPLYYVVTYDEYGNPTVTTEETTTNTGYPVYTTETYTEARYLPNNEDRYVAIPDSGYYVANIPQSCQCVISYKPDVTDLEVIVVKHGAFANLASQIFGIYEHRTMVEAVTSLAYKVDALIESKNRIGNATAGKLDVSELTTALYPRVLYGHGTPSASVVPVNLPDGLPWDGYPVFIGQLYVNLDASSGGLYYANGVDAVSNWKNA